MFARLMIEAARSDNPIRDQVMLMLSYKAGLRAAEIAGLEWIDVCDAQGVVREDHFFVPGDIAKKGRERTIPMNPHLLTALRLLQSERVEKKRGSHILYKTERKGSGKMTPNAVQMWFARIYKKHGFEGCSSHSGRRTFITQLARKAGQHDCSIKDVQLLAGHAHLGTTEHYIEPSPNVGRLVASI